MTTVKELEAKLDAFTQKTELNVSTLAERQAQYEEKVSDSINTTIVPETRRLKNRTLWVCVLAVLLVLLAIGSAIAVGAYFHGLLPWKPPAPTPPVVVVAPAPAPPPPVVAQAPQPPVVVKEPITLNVDIHMPPPEPKPVTVIVPEPAGPAPQPPAAVAEKPALPPVLVLPPQAPPAEPAAPPVAEPEAPLPPLPRPRPAYPLEPPKGVTCNGTDHPAPVKGKPVVCHFRDGSSAIISVE